MDNDLRRIEATARRQDFGNSQLLRQHPGDDCSTRQHIKDLDAYLSNADFSLGYAEWISGYQLRCAEAESRARAAEAAEQKAEHECLAAKASSMQGGGEHPLVGSYSNEEEADGGYGWSWNTVTIRSDGTFTSVNWSETVDTSAKKGSTTNGLWKSDVSDVLNFLPPHKGAVSADGTNATGYLQKWQTQLAKAGK